MIAIIMSSLALLAALIGIGFTFSERKRNQKRNTDLMRHAENVARNVADGLTEHIKSMQANIEELANKTTALQDKLTQLENGVIPDYEKAKEAAKAVNDFNAGITGILGFDPYAALQAQRDKDRGGE